MFRFGDRDLIKDPITLGMSKRGGGGGGGGGIYLIKGYLTGHSVNNIGFRRA